MRRLAAICLCLVFLLALSIPVAANEITPVYSSVESLEDGIVVIDEVFEASNTRSTDKTYTRRRTFTREGTTIAVIAITATFRYDGTTVSVVSKSVSQADTYDGWSYQQNSFTSSGGTVTLSGKLAKLLILNSSFTMDLSCDKDGNISYT